MGGSSSQQQPTQTTTTTISPQAQQLFNLAYPSIAQYAAAPPISRYPDSTVAGFTPTQEVAQAAGVSAAGAQAGVADRANALAAAIPGMLTDYSATPYNPTTASPYTPVNWSPSNITTSSNIFSDPGIWNAAANPGLTAAIEAAQRPTWQGLTEQALPSIRYDAISQGPFGGTREALAEGLATSRANQTAADIAAQMANAQYGANLSAVNQRYATNLNEALQKYGVDANTLLALGSQGLTARAQDIGAATTTRGQDITAEGQRYGQNLAALYQTLGLTPQLQAAYTQPASTLGAVGDVQQQMNQAQLNDAINAYYYQQMAPYLKATDILGLVPSIPGASTTSTGNVPQPNPTTQALGGALSGAAIGSTFGPIGTGVGAIGGATLPFLFR